VVSRVSERQQIHAVVFKDAGSDQWVALCLEYHVTTQGDSEEHAKAMLQEAVELYLEDAGAEERELLYQPIEGEPRFHTLTVNAPSLLHR
jgi:predicted RNase H-like HicB family nuclease